VRIAFEEESRRWLISNGLLEAAFQLTPSGDFQFQDLRHLSTSWTKAGIPAPSLIRFRIKDGAQERWWDGTAGYQLLSHRETPTSRGGRQLSITLQDHARRLELTVDLEMFPKDPVLRYGVRLRNLSGETLYLTGADMLAVDLAAAGGNYQALRVEQWMPVENPADFKANISPLDPSGKQLVIESGAHGRDCGWLAVADGSGRGLVAGWEFDGRANAAISHDALRDILKLSATIQGIHHPVEPGEEFTLPRAFLGAFQGSFEEAGWVTQRFVENALARQPVVRGETVKEFPFVGWDSWAYGQALHETTLRRNAEAAARMGIELFIVDLGWARNMGDWHADASKFPSGLRALSDYVHLLGMKFGLHVALAESSPHAPVLKQNPDWRSSKSYGYYGADSLCLSHQPVKEWITAELVRIIDEFDVDWILQDGENMVKECTKTTHTHHPLDSNYSNAVDGLNAVVREVQRQRPDVLWENCENGGNLMTFQMVQQYVTSILNDASGARSARQAVYGATYPFPARYADRYMPEERLDSYITRSYMIGGPWIFMNRLTEMRAEDIQFAAEEIARFKQIRPLIRNGRISRLSPPPAEGITDAIAVYDPDFGLGVAVVTRDQSPDSLPRVRFTNLRAHITYLVWFANDSRSLTMTGQQLAEDGVLIFLPLAQSSEIVYVEALR